MVIVPVRGHVYRMEDPEYGTLHCLAVAVQRTGLTGDTFLAVRVTVKRVPWDFPGWVRTGAGDPVGGYVVVHDLDRVDYEELAEDLGPLSMETMVGVEKALKVVLGL